VYRNIIFCCFENNILHLRITNNNRHLKKKVYCNFDVKYKFLKTTKISNFFEVGFQVVFLGFFGWGFWAVFLISTLP